MWKGDLIETSNQTNAAHANNGLGTPISLFQIQ